MKTLIIAMLLLMTNTGVYAYISNVELHYITDSVDIPIRSSNKIQSNPSNLLRMLPSNTELQLLSPGSGWSQVEFDGLTGWVVSRYITSTKPAKVKLKERSRLIKVLILKNKKIRADLKAVQDKYNKLLAELGGVLC